MATRRISDGPASYLPQDDIARRQELIWQIRTLSETSRWDETTKETGREAVFWGLLHTLDITGLSNLLEQTQKDSENIDRFGTNPSVFKIAYRCGKLARVFREAPIKPIPRPSEPELDKARLRDGHKCIITGWYTTDVGHIFPHHARTRMSEVYSAVMEMDLVWSRKYRHALYSKPSERVIDSVSNMLCTDRPAQWLWSEGFFALEPLVDNIDYEVEAPTALPSSDSEGDVEMAGTTRRTKKVYGLRLRFHWLPRTTLRSPDGPVDFSADPRQMGRPLDHPDIYLLDANGRPVETGRIVEIYSEDEGALPDRDLIRLHWDMLRVHALAGGADRSFYMNAFHSLDYDYEKRAARKAFTAAVISKCRNTKSRGKEKRLENKFRREYGFPELPVYDEDTDIDDLDDLDDLDDPDIDDDDPDDSDYHDSVDDEDLSYGSYSDDDMSDDGAGHDVTTEELAQLLSDIQDEPWLDARDINGAPLKYGSFWVWDMKASPPPPRRETEQVEEERAPQDPPPGFFQTMRRRSVGFLLGQRFWRGLSSHQCCTTSKKTDGAGRDRWECLPWTL